MKTNPVSSVGKPYKLRLLSIVLGIMVSVVAVVIGYNYWQDYRDRPFMDGFSYVGRYYDPGTVILRSRLRAENEAYYYETDIAPDQLGSHLNGYVFDSKVDSRLWENSTNMYYKKANDSTNRTITIGYVDDQKNRAK